MSDYANRDLVALDEMDELLKAYADTRLAPATPALTRMRSAVIARAAASAARTRRGTSG